MTRQAAGRLDRTVRVTMWLDAFLSVAMVLAAVVVIPVIAMLGVPHGIRLAVGLATLVCGVLLAAFGAITAVALSLRMRAGDYFLPTGMYVPLPPGLNPLDGKQSA